MSTLAAVLVTFGLLTAAVITGVVVACCMIAGEADERAMAEESLRRHAEHEPPTQVYDLSGYRHRERIRNAH